MLRTLKIYLFNFLSEFLIYLHKFIYLLIYFLSNLITIFINFSLIFNFIIFLILLILWLWGYLREYNMRIIIFEFQRWCFSPFRLNLVIFFRIINFIIDFIIFLILVDILRAKRFILLHIWTDANLGIMPAILNSSWTL